MLPELHSLDLKARRDLHVAMALSATPIDPATVYRFFTQPTQAHWEALAPILLTTAGPPAMTWATALATVLAEERVAPTTPPDPEFVLKALIYGTH